MSDAVIVIPARYGSQRFPGKPLVSLTGATGQAKSLIRRSWEAAMAVPEASAVWIATDDDRIRTAAEAFGAQVVMTPASCANGTERVAAALQALGIAPAVAVNLQGDAPLTPPWFVSALIAAMAGGASDAPSDAPSDVPSADASADASDAASRGASRGASGGAAGGVAVATPVLRCSPQALTMLREDRRHGRVGGTTAVFGADRRALYFSKEVLPFAADPAAPVYHHVGVYAYTPAALARYATLPPGRLEALEGLEQLRFLEHGLPVACVEVEDRGRAFWEVNTPEDVPRVESVLQAEGIA